MQIYVCMCKRTIQSLCGWNWLTLMTIILVNYSLKFLLFNYILLHSDMRYYFLRPLCISVQAEFLYIVYIWIYVDPMFLASCYILLCFYFMKISVIGLMLLYMLFVIQKNWDQTNYLWYVCKFFNICVANLFIHLIWWIHVEWPSYLWYLCTYNMYFIGNLYSIKLLYLCEYRMCACDLLVLYNWVTTKNCL